MPHAHVQIAGDEQVPRPLRPEQTGGEEDIELYAGRDILRRAERVVALHSFESQCAQPTDDRHATHPVVPVAAREHGIASRDEPGVGDDQHLVVGADVGPEEHQADEAQRALGPEAPQTPDPTDVIRRATQTHGAVVADRPEKCRV